jgi:hypothetical protein
MLGKTLSAECVAIPLLTPVGPNHFLSESLNGDETFYNFLDQKGTPWLDWFQFF